MTRLLFTFLGAVQKGYATVTYDFGGGELRSASYFAKALLDQLRSVQTRKPNRLIVLGTSGSMWDDVLASLAPPLPDDDAGTELFGALHDAGMKDAITAPMLAPLRDRLRAALDIDVELRLVSYAETELQAFEMVALLASLVGRRDVVEFDITHGLRHLPILALFAALVVEAMKEARIEGIWYGARELGRNRAAAPVIRLDGLIAISRWIRALAAFDAAGDLRSLAGLLAPGDRPAAGRFDQAAYRERILRLDGIETQIRDVLREVAERPDPVIGLFRPHLSRRLSWSGAPTLSTRQHRLARIYLDAGDYVRAAILGLEAVISQEMEQDGGFMEQDLRDDLKRSQFQAELGKESVRWRKRARRSGDAEVAAWVNAFHDLKEVRNAFAHASPEKNVAVSGAMSDEQRMRRFLSGLLDTLLDDAPS